MEINCKLETHFLRIGVKSYGLIFNSYGVGAKSYGVKVNSYGLKVSSYGVRAKSNGVKAKLYEVITNSYAQTHPNCISVTTNWYEM